MESGPSTDDDSSRGESVLAVLRDADSRCILSALTRPMAASEIEATCNIPLSTTYRKLDELMEASLVTRRFDVNPERGYTTRYETDFESLTVTLDAQANLRVSVDRDQESIPDPSHW